MKLATALAELEGLNPTEIGVKLMNDGAKGQRSCAETCPLADWLSFKCRGRASVSQTFIYIFPWKGDLDVVYSERAVTPDNVAQFITNFDNGLYSGLGEDE